MSIFVFNKANIEFFKSSTWSHMIQNAPYWSVVGRVCYHVHETAEYVIHHEHPLRYIPEIYDSYLHIHKDKKPLYAMSSYTHADLVDMCTRLELPVGTKTQMYSKIKEEIDKTMIHFKKIDPQ
jgi:hypothetical protein